MRKDWNHVKWAKESVYKILNLSFILRGFKGLITDEDVIVNSFEFND